MDTKILYVLISDCGDGSYSTQYTLNPELISDLRKAYDEGRMDFENGVGCDGDGFHYDMINVPADATATSLGISVMDDDYVDYLYEDEE